MTVRAVTAAWRVVVVLIGCVLAAAGCVTNTEDSGPAPAKVQESRVDAIAALLPESIRSSGRLTVGVNLPYAPNEFKNSAGAIVGFDVDLLDAAAAVLGVRTDYHESDFEKIIPAIEAGTLDMGMSSFTDTAEREQSVDFVDYFSAGIQWAQRQGKPVDPRNACGKKVAVQRGTVEETADLPARSKACVAAGRPAIISVPYDDQAAAATALVLGQVDALSADSPVTAYAVKRNPGALEVTGPLFQAAPYGWPVAKGSPLAPALQQALQHLITSGDYRRIAVNWGVQTGAVATAVRNAASGSGS